jgi:hypothetical protein
MNQIIPNILYIFARNNTTKCFAISNVYADIVQNNILSMRNPSTMSHLRSVIPTRVGVFWQVMSLKLQYKSQATNGPTIVHTKIAIQV